VERGSNRECILRERVHKEIEKRIPVYSSRHPLFLYSCNIIKKQ
jgi:hypothetical protein